MLGQWKAAGDKGPQRSSSQFSLGGPAAQTQNSIAPSSSCQVLSILEIDLIDFLLSLEKRRRMAKCPFSEKGVCRSAKALVTLHGQLYIKVQWTDPTEPREPSKATESQQPAKQEETTGQADALQQPEPQPESQTEQEPEGAQTAQPQADLSEPAAQAPAEQPLEAEGALNAAAPDSANATAAVAPEKLVAAEEEPPLPVEGIPAVGRTEDTAVQLPTDAVAEAAMEP